jgi:2-polyprenyl-3-methyl-5-hydroxy-6-metoxy-1,4-benzoquinol methylase
MKQIPNYFIKAVKECYGIEGDDFIKILEDPATNQKACNDEWEHRETNDSFYQHSKNYVFGLIGFNNYNRVFKVLCPIMEAENKKILDFGGGIGELGMQMSKGNDVYYYDLDGEIQNFAKYLSAMTNRPMTFLKETEVFEQKYDIILIMDVLEHLEDPVGTLKKLIDCLAPRGIIITSGYNFVIKKEFPMHLPKNKEARQGISELMCKNFDSFYTHYTRDETIFGIYKKEEIQ